MSAPLPSVLSPRALGSVDDLSASFARATPFRHVVIDDFLDAGFARRLAAQFPDFDRGDSLGEDGKPGGKSTCDEAL